MIGDDDVRRDDVDGQTDGRNIFAMRCNLSMLEGFGYKSSLMNWKPEILKMELQIRSKCETMAKMMMSDRA